MRPNSFISIMLSKKMESKPEQVNWSGSIPLKMFDEEKIVSVAQKK